MPSLCLGQCFARSQGVNTRDPRSCSRGEVTPHICSVLGCSEQEQTSRKLEYESDEEE